MVIGFDLDHDNSAVILIHLTGALACASFVTALFTDDVERSNL